MRSASVRPESSKLAKVSRVCIENDSGTASVATARATKVESAASVRASAGTTSTPLPRSAFTAAPPMSRVTS